MSTSLAREESLLTADADVRPCQKMKRNILGHPKSLSPALRGRVQFLMKTNCHLLKTAGLVALIFGVHVNAPAQEIRRDPPPDGVVRKVTVTKRMGDVIISQQTWLEVAEDKNAARLHEAGRPGLRDRGTVYLEQAPLPPMAGSVSARITRREAAPAIERITPREEEFTAESRAAPAATRTFASPKKEIPVQLRSTSTRSEGPSRQIEVRGQESLEGKSFPALAPIPDPPEPKAKSPQKNASEDDGKKIDVAQVPFATKATANPNYVKSPFGSHREIDVAGLASGSLAQDPTTGKIFRVP